MIYISSSVKNYLLNSTFRYKHVVDEEEKQELLVAVFDSGLVKLYDTDSLVLVGSGDDAAVIKSQKANLVHSLDISKIHTHFPNKA